VNKEFISGGARDVAVEPKGLVEGVVVLKREGAVLVVVAPNGDAVDAPNGEVLVAPNGDVVLVAPKGDVVVVPPKGDVEVPPSDNVGAVEVPPKGFAGVVVDPKPNGFAGAVDVVVVFRDNVGTVEVPPKEVLVAPNGDVEVLKEGVPNVVAPNPPKVGVEVAGVAWAPNEGAVEPKPVKPAID
jgi:hypothetical protein